jgi:hypothetical protein
VLIALFCELILFAHRAAAHRRKAAGIDLDPDPVWEWVREPRVGLFDTTGAELVR